MSGKKAFVPVLVVAVLGTTSAAWSRFDIDDRNHQGSGAVLPCSLDGINPVWHRYIFGNPALARTYGFIQARDGSWHVVPGCVRRY
jgi:hypothetical protein